MIWLIEFVLVSMCFNDNKLNCNFVIISILWLICIYIGIYIYDFMMLFFKCYIKLIDYVIKKIRLMNLRMK